MTGLWMLMRLWLIYFGRWSKFHLGWRFGEWQWPMSFMIIASSAQIPALLWSGNPSSKQYLMVIKLLSLTFLVNSRHAIHLALLIMRFRPCCHVALGQYLHEPRAWDASAIVELETACIRPLHRREKSFLNPASGYTGEIGGYPEQCSISRSSMWSLPLHTSVVVPPGCT